MSGKSLSMCTSALYPTERRVSLQEISMLHACQVKHTTLLCSEWARGDSNSQPLRDTLLRRTRIPIPPRAHSKYK